MNALLSSPTASPSPTLRQPRSRKIAPSGPLVVPTPPVAEVPGAGSVISDQTRIIVAKINVGYGNTVYLRGEGGCLNWDLGVPMICSDNDRWIWCCQAGEAPTQFKFLRNDRDWALGDNQVMSGADIMVCYPKFPR